MKRIEAISQVSRSGCVRLFDQDGLPWTSRIRWGILLFSFAVIFLVLAPLVGLSLGIWLISNGRTALSLTLYLALVVASLPAFFGPFPKHDSIAETILIVAILSLWLVSAFALRLDVMRYYSGREGVPFPLNPALTALFGPWYVGGHLRPDFPLDNAGMVGRQRQHETA